MSLIEKASYGDLKDKCPLCNINFKFGESITQVSLPDRRKRVFTGPRKRISDFIGRVSWVHVACTNKDS